MVFGRRDTTGKRISPAVVLLVFFHRIAERRVACLRALVVDFSDEGIQHTKSLFA